MRPHPPVSLLIKEQKTTDQEASSPRPVNISEDDKDNNETTVQEDVPVHEPAPGPVRQSLTLSPTIYDGQRGGSSDTGEGEVLSTGPNLSPLDDSFILLAPREYLMGHTTETNIFAH